MADIEALKSAPKRTTRNTATKAPKKEALKIGEITPLDLRNWDGENLYVRNNSRNPISFDDKKGNILFLGGVQTGEHIAGLSIEIARNAGMQRLWRAGTISISTDPEMEDELFLAEEEQDRVAAAALKDKFAPQAQSLDANGNPVWKPANVTTTGGENVVYSGKAETFEANY